MRDNPTYFHDVCQEELVRANKRPQRDESQDRTLAAHLDRPIDKHIFQQQVDTGPLLLTKPVSPN